jgi:hypothetical protein
MAPQTHASQKRKSSEVSGDEAWGTLASEGGTHVLCSPRRGPRGYWQNVGQRNMLIKTELRRVARVETDEILLYK